VLIAWAKLRDFRTYTRASVELSPGITVIHGPNGAGKTNLLEGLYFGCTARSMRTTNEREMIRFGSSVARVVVGTVDDCGTHELSVGYGLDPPQGKPIKRMQVDGVPVERLSGDAPRPLIGVFFPDRLELVKGSPSLRRTHIDQLSAVIWPARSSTRSAYSHALLQRNALLSGIRAGRYSRASLPSWDAEVARLAVELRDQRSSATSLLAVPFRERARELGLSGSVGLEYRPRSTAVDVESFISELQQRTESDIDRGFSMHGPHRDEIAIVRDRRELRAYGSQGEQRLALLALLLAERDVLAEKHGHTPLMLLDDVMSELDSPHRNFLVDVLSSGGQSVITATSAAHVPKGHGVRTEITPEDVSRAQPPSNGLMLVPQ
jgi:DNA replication and repair protein RecF